ncbi:hypothetical protein [Sandaracinus amylolyticus]|uniref:hypothetical protein n=1 Tax=Sandaracinus amylolyticus TaxID=927083 RepID=UPI001F2345E6|nr:hypothetical protein [Sandaracinus amylolyticus]UJR85604.1 Hypothetical protein I5071_76840 [Sandaracinus amylolyticus]
MTHRSSVVSWLALCLAIAGCRAGAVPPATMGDAGVQTADDGGAIDPIDDPDAGEAPAASFRVSAASHAVVVRRNESATLELTIDRDAGYDATLAITIEGLPEHVQASAPAGVAGESATITFSAEAIAQPGEAPITVRVADGDDAVALELFVVTPGDAGATDESFGTGGIAANEEATYSVVGLASDELGRIYTTYGALDGDTVGVFVRRLDRRGQADATWNGGAPSRVPLSSGSGLALGGIVVDDDGRVVLLVSASVEGTQHAFLAVLDASGAPLEGGARDLGAYGARGLDRAGDRIAALLSTSDDAGSTSVLQVYEDLAAEPVITRELPSMLGSDVLVDASGRFVVIGSDLAASAGVVVRVDAEGAIDSTFAAGRRAITSDGTVMLVAGGLMHDGSLLVVGREGAHPFAARVDDAGELVDGFGTAGGRMRYDAISGGFRGVDVDRATGEAIAVGDRDANALLIGDITGGGALDPTFVPPAEVTGLQAAIAVAMTSDRRVLVGSSDGERGSVVRLWR